MSADDTRSGFDFNITALDTCVLTPGAKDADEFRFVRISEDLLSCSWFESVGMVWIINMTLMYEMRWCYSRS
jgi:hypothetical protein